MKIIHTADWHLGQTFYDFSRHEEHAAFLLWLRKTVAERQADLLLIAGDVFDSPNPPPDAQELYYKFLHDVTRENVNLQIIIIAGNHDSAARLEAPSSLLKALNIHVCGSVKRTPDYEIAYPELVVPVKINNEIAAWCMTVPYLRHGDYPPADSYAKGVAGLFHAVYESVPDKSLPVIAMAHLQASGAAVSVNDRSERIIIGGEEGLPADILPAGIAYTALGHLHRAQRLPHRENARYAGAPLPMSFAEKHNRQGVVFADITDSGVSIEHIGFIPPVGLLSIYADTIAELLDKLELLPGGTKIDAPYLELTVRIREPEPSLRSRVEELLENRAVRLASLHTLMSGKKAERLTVSDDVRLMPEPFDVANDIFRRKGLEMSEDMQELLKEAIRDAEKNYES